MKTVKNTAETDLVIGFEGNDYTFPAGVVVACEDNLADFIKLSFELFEVDRLSVGKEGEAVPRVYSKPSKVYTPVSQQRDGLGTDVSFIRHQTDDTNTPDELPKSGEVDKDGVAWVGEGIEKDTP